MTLHVIVSFLYPQRIILHVPPFEGHWSREYSSHPLKGRGRIWWNVRVGLAAETPRTMEPLVWRHIDTVPYSWQVSFQHLLHPWQWLGFAKLRISWSNRSKQQNSSSVALIPSSLLPGNHSLLYMAALPISEDNYPVPSEPCLLQGIHTS